MDPEKNSLNGLFSLLKMESPKVQVWLAIHWPFVSTVNPLSLHLTQLTTCESTHFPSNDSEDIKSSPYTASSGCLQLQGCRLRGMWWWQMNAKKRKWVHEWYGWGDAICTFVNIYIFIYIDYIYKCICIYIYYIQMHLYIYIGTNIVFYSVVDS